MTLTGRANAILGSIRVGDVGAMSLPATAAPYLAATVLLGAAGVAKTVRPGDTANALRAAGLSSRPVPDPGPGRSGGRGGAGASPPWSFPGALTGALVAAVYAGFAGVHRGGPPQGLGPVVVRLLRPAGHSARRRPMPSSTSGRRRRRSGGRRRGAVRADGLAAARARSSGTSPGTAPRWASWSLFCPGLAYLIWTDPLPAARR